MSSTSTSIEVDFPNATFPPTHIEYPLVVGLDITSSTRNITSNLSAKQPVTAFADLLLTNVKSGDLVRMSVVVAQPTKTAVARMIGNDIDAWLAFMVSPWVRRVVEREVCQLTNSVYLVASSAPVAACTA